MKNNTVNNNNKATLIEIIKALKPREAVNGKEYPEYKKGLEAVLNTCYTVYQAREQGKATKEAESEAMASVTEFLHTLGKANGKYISVCEKTTNNGVTSVLFDTLVYHSFRDRIFTKSTTLASLENAKSQASRQKAEAHEKLVNGKGTATAYKEAVKAYNEAVKAVQDERAKANAEGTLTEKESVSKFVKFTTARLKAIIENRFALSDEEAEALRKLRNKEAKAKRSEAKADTGKAKQGKKASKEAPKQAEATQEAPQEADKKTA